MTDWYLSLTDLEAIALGAGVLGTGGGGSTYLALLRAKALLAEGKSIRVISPDTLHDDALVLPLGGIGAPTVSIEKLDEGGEAVRAVKAIEKLLGRRVDALIADEIGGGNCFAPMLAAAELDLPVVDCDGMGRAFPETQMTSFFIGGQECGPAALTDAKGTVMIVADAPSPEDLEHLMRAATISMGCTAMMATAPMSGAFIKAHGILNSVSLAHCIGTAIAQANDRRDDPVAAIAAASGGDCIFRGKIADIERKTRAGFARGVLRLEGLDDDKGRELHIDIQNEFLVAHENNKLVTLVPDLICVVDSETGNAVATEELRYGLRVSVLCLPAPARLRSDAALAIVGPRAFGYDHDFAPMQAAFNPPLSDQYKRIPTKGLKPEKP